MGDMMYEPQLWGGICLLVWVGSVAWSLKQFISRRRKAQNRDDPGLLVLLSAGLFWLLGWSATAWVTFWIYSALNTQSLLMPLLAMLARTGVDAIFLGSLHAVRPVAGLKSAVVSLLERVAEEVPRLFFFFGLFGIWLGGLV